MDDYFWAFPVVLQMVQLSWIMIGFEVSHAVESHIFNKGKHKTYS